MGDIGLLLQEQTWLQRKQIHSYLMQMFTLVKTRDLRQELTNIKSAQSVKNLLLTKLSNQHFKHTQPHQPQIGGVSVSGLRCGDL